MTFDESAMPIPAIRPATARDMPAIAKIYEHYVLRALGTFEEEPPTAERMAERWQAIVDRGLPYLVAEVDGEIAGFAYAAPYRTRTAYRYTLEDSIYVAPAFLRKGIGRGLLDRLVALATESGYRQMVSVIGDSGNIGSIRVHEAAGFVRAGILPNVGYKLGRWVDSVLMQRGLGEGARTPPNRAE